MFKLTVLATFLIVTLLQFKTAELNPILKKLTPEQINRIQNYKDSDEQNIWELSGQFEGDIVLRPGQKNGLLDERRRWNNNEIPYEFDDALTQEQKDWVSETLMAYQEETCITARPRTSEDTDYIYITSDSSGCWSYVGRLGGRQQLNLAPNNPGSGCFRYGTILHEFLHALGFYHQQSATERDDFVTIVWQNIEIGKENNFNKYDADTVSSFGETYDYGSVMHYSATAFSVNGEKTIVPNDPNAVIGQRNGFSAIDIAKLNKMYGC